VFAIADLRRTVEETGAEIAVLTVPAAAAVEAYDALAAAGVRAVLNFAPVSLPERDQVRLKNVDLRTYLEEASFLLTPPRSDDRAKSR
jgi:redox-sensing transcriptional repressor